jgi:hypothetical protein
MNGKNARPMNQTTKGKKQWPYPIVLGDQVWCPRCGEYVQLLRVRKAAKIADVSNKTIYRYLDEGKVHCVKVAGSTTRVCSGSLFQDKEETYPGQLRR